LFAGVHGKVPGVPLPVSQRLKARRPHE